jgi:replication factor C subunit 3/5
MDLGDRVLMACSEKITDQVAIQPPDWEALIGQIANDIMSEHSPAMILKVRAKLYDLLSHCIPATTILKVFLSSIHFRTAY